MAKKFKKISTERILALVATLVGVLTLIIFVYQTNIIHRQSRLSVTPRLLVSTLISNNDSMLDYSFVVENKGIGPAIIDVGNIVDNGKKYDLDFESYLKETHPKLFELGEFYKLSTMTTGSTLSPNEKQILFTYGFKKDNMETIQKTLKIDNEDNYPFRVVIEYSSIYEERWRIDTDITGHPEKLD